MQATTQPKVFIVVLNYNGKDVLLPCLLSIYQSDYPNLEIVVVDNDSKDGSLEQARKSFSRAHFIQNPTNVGFSKGNNLGIRWALEKFADYIFILNNDTAIERTTISTLARAMDENPAAGIISPLIMTGNTDRIWFAGGLINWREMKTSHLEQAISDTPYMTQYLSGCALFVRKDVFKQVGLFDERFFLYYEDADFSLRTKKSGFDLLVVPLAHIQHLEQSNSQNILKTYWLVLSGLLFFQTHTSFLQKIWMIPYIWLRKLKNFYDLFFTKNLIAADVRRAYQDFNKIPR